MSVTKQNGVVLGGEDLESAITRHLYAHLKLDENGGDILNDSSGNGHDFNWYAGGTNATALAAGIWTPDGLQYGPLIDAGDSWLASDKTEFQFENPNASSVYVCTFTLDAVLTASSALMQRRGGIGGLADSGWQWYMQTIEKPLLTLRDPAAVTGGNPPVTLLTTIAAGDSVTVAMCYDSSTNEIFMIQATESSVAQFEVTTKTNPATTWDYTQSEQIAAIGGRSAFLPSSENTQNMHLHNFRCYEDLSGGALPANLPDIIRWLHINKTKNIPAKWWS